MLGIDELNIISRDDDSAGGGSGGSGGGVGGGGGFDIPLPTYDFLGNAVNSRVESIVAMIKDAMWEITWSPVVLHLPSEQFWLQQV